MTIQNFSIYTARGYEGELIDSGPRVVQTGVLTSTNAGFGKAILRDDATVERGVKLKDTGDANIFAISQREYNHEAGTRPSTGNDTLYLQNESVSLMREGFIYLKVTERAAVAGAKANTVDAGATFTGGAAGAGETQCANVTWEQSGAVGDVVKARIDIQA